MRSKRILLFALMVAAAFILGACGGEEVEIEVYYSPGDAFVTNIMDSDDLLVKVVVSLAIRRDATVELTEKNSILRDCILSIIRSTPLEQLKAPDMQTNLSNQIVDQLNALFPPGEEDGGKPLFTRVYFLDFVIN